MSLVRIPVVFVEDGKPEKIPIARRALGEIDSPISLALQRVLRWGLTPRGLAVLIPRRKKRR